MVSLGLYMICKNEEEVVERCLKSFIGDETLFDQVVLVDTGSTDNTKTIARKFNCQIYDFTWINDFSAARNFALSKIKTDFCVWCDLDDVLPEKDFQKLKVLKPNLCKDIYLCSYNYAQDENNKSLSTLYRERIHKNDPKLRWKYCIHEVIPLQSNFTTETTDIEIVHKRTGAGFSADLNRNIKMLEASLEKPEYKNDPRVLYYYAKELFDAGQWERAVKELKKFIAISGGWYEDQICAQQKLAESYRMLGKLDLARKEAFKAIEMDYRWAEPYYTLASICLDKSDWHQAIHWFELCRRPTPNVLSPVRTDYYTWLPNLQLCVCYNSIGDMKKAYDRNKEALGYKPNDPRMLNNDTILYKALHPETKAETKEVVKTTNGIGWVSAGIALEVPQYRIRTYNINRWLQSKGCKSDIIDAGKIGDYDTLVFDPAFTESNYNIILSTKNSGKRVVVNLCESLFEFNNEWYSKSLSIAETVVCCSHALAERVKEVNPNVVVIGDAVEASFGLNCFYKDDHKLKVVYCGMGGGKIHAEKIRPIIERLGYELVLIHEHADATIPWKLDTWIEEVVKCDIGIAPCDYVKQPCKSNVKATTYMALGLPVICSPLPAYVRFIENGKNGFVAQTDQEWEDALEQLRDRVQRSKIGQAGKRTAGSYSIDAIGKQWQNLLIKKDETVDIIIPTYDNPQYLEQCINSIKACTDVPYNIIVVDAKKEKTNFSQSINLGIKRGKAPYVCLLNDDTIVSKGWIRPLIEQVKGGIGFVNPLSNCDKGWLHNYDLIAGGVSLQPGTHKMGQISPQSIYDFKSPSSKIFTRDWVAFFATMTSREVIEKVGLLDDEFKTGSEDLDYCTRANRLGYKCAVNEGSFVFHFGGISRKRHEDEDPQRHIEEDVYNNSRIKFKYGKKLIIIHSGLAWSQWNPRTLYTEGLGGSETWAIRMSEEFVKLGYRVVCFGPMQDEVYNGVEWKHESKWNSFIDMNYIDICIISRYPQFLESSIRAGKKYLMTHDVHPMGDSGLTKKHIDSGNLNAVMCLSSWHRDYVSQVCQIPKEKIILVGNGIDL